MSNQRYPEEFKIQAVKQVTEKQLAARCRLHVQVHPRVGAVIARQQRGQMNRRGAVHRAQGELA